MSATATRSIEWTEVRDRIFGARAANNLPPWVKLPGVPDRLLECVRRARDPEVGTKELGRILELDAGLTVQLLRYANSAAFGFVNPCATAAEAMTRLGVRRAVLFLLTEGMKHVMKHSQSKVLDVRRFWSENLERGLFAKHVARLLGADEDVAYAGGLLCDALLPQLTNQASRTYIRFLCDDGGRRLVDFEEKEFRWHHALATAMIFAGWHFDAELVCCVGLHHEAETLLTIPHLRRTSAAAVAIAALVPDQAKQEPGNWRRLEKIARSLPGFDPLAIAARVHEDFVATAPEAENPHPLVRRLQDAKRKK